MAIISEDTRLTIATRLANLNYKEKLDALQENSMNPLRSDLSARPLMMS